MSRIFVRERSNVGEGAGRPRFAVVAVEGADLKVYHSHLRRAELDKLAAEIGAEVIYLPRGEHAEEEEPGSRRGMGRGMGRRHRQGRAQNQE